MSGKNKGVVFLIFLIVAGVIGIRFFNLEKDSDEEIKIKIKKIESRDIKADDEKTEKIDERIDINKAEISDFKRFKISEGIAAKIVRQRKRIGFISDIDNLDNINGVGVKTLEKLKENFYVAGNDKFQSINKIDINKGTDEELKFIGFNKQDLKKLKEWKKKNGDVFSNIDLMKIIGESKYEKVEKYIRYQ